MSDTSEKISKILEDPDNLKMIAQIAENFLGDSSNLNDENLNRSETISVHAKDKKEGDEVPGLNLLQDILDNSDIDNTIKLITSLKPYLSHRRKNNTENVLRILNILKMSEKINLSDLNNLLH